MSFVPEAHAQPKSTHPNYVSALLPAGQFVSFQSDQPELPEAFQGAGFKRSYLKQVYGIRRDGPQVATSILMSA